MIYICIPAYNEEHTAGVLLWKIRQVMSDFQRDYEVLFLDDGSTDRTPEVVTPYTQVLPVQLFRHETREGYGSSVEELMREAVKRCGYPRRDVVVTLQADFTEEPMAIPTMVKRIEGGADLVVAAQQPNGRSVPLAMRWIRKGVPWLERRYDFPEGISDPISSLRAYRVGILKRALQRAMDEPLVKRDGWAANVELLLAVAPYTRRGVQTHSAPRYDRRVRPSRQSLWSATRDFLALVRQR